jgi:hypothetical protein
MDRSRRGLWIGLGIGGLVLMLCCVGGVVGVVVIAANASAEMGNKGRVIVTRYLDALRDEDYGTAYSLRCLNQNDRQTRNDFVSRQRLAPRPVRYTVGRAKVGSDVRVPAAVQYDRGLDVVLTFTLVADSGSTELKVCGITG